MSEGGGGGGDDGSGGGGVRSGNRGKGIRQNRHQRDKRESSRSKTIIGKSVKDGLISVKGADLTVNKYVGRFHNDVTLDGLRDYIVSQNVTVVELEQLDTKHGRFKSFRLRVKRAELDRIEDADFWPQGVIFSSFFRPKSEEHPASLAAPTSLING